jgi:hypothetical protein
MIYMRGAGIELVFSVLGEYLAAFWMKYRVGKGRTLITARNPS